MFDTIFLFIVALAGLALFIVVLAAVRNYKANVDARICPFCDTTFRGDFCMECGCDKCEGYEFSSN